VGAARDVVDAGQQLAIQINTWCLYTKVILVANLSGWLYPGCTNMHALSARAYLIHLPESLSHFPFSDEF
jgi:hypothetical protein